MVPKEKKRQSGGGILLWSLKKATQFLKKFINAISSGREITVSKERAYKEPIVLTLPSFFDFKNLRKYEKYSCDEFHLHGFWKADMTQLWRPLLLIMIEKSRIFLDKRGLLFGGYSISSTRCKNNQMNLIYTYLWADFDFYTP